MILYHGSNIDIEIIDLAKSNQNPIKISGRDFICRKMKHRHKKWLCLNLCS